MEVQKAVTQKHKRAPPLPSIPLPSSSFSSSSCPIASFFSILLCILYIILYDYILSIWFIVFPLRVNGRLSPPLWHLVCFPFLSSFASPFFPRLLPFISRCNNIYLCIFIYYLLSLICDALFDGIKSNGR